MHYAHRENEPPVPQTVADIQLDGPRGETLSGEPYVISNNENFIVLATTKNLGVLSDCGLIFMDGTFKSYPAFYT
jgi:hypothetical protein